MKNKEEIKGLLKTGLKAVDCNNKEGLKNVINNIKEALKK